MNTANTCLLDNNSPQRRRSTSTSLTSFRDSSSARVSTEVLNVADDILFTTVLLSLLLLLLLLSPTVVVVVVIDNVAISMYRMTSRENTVTMIVVKRDLQLPRLHSTHLFSLIAHSRAQQLTHFPTQCPTPTTTYLN